MSKSPWLAVADSTGAASGARILAAAPLSEAEAMNLGQALTIELAEFDLATRALKAKRVRRLGAIVLSETPLPKPSGAAARAALIAAIKTHGFDLLADAAAIRETQARLALARANFGDSWPDWADDALIADADEWLAPLFGDPPQLNRPTADQLRSGMMARLGWSAARELDALFPRDFIAPSGRSIAVDYAAEGGPLIEARAQEFYGLDAHPTIARGRIALTVSLLSPARRQIALTRDLPGFWRGGYADMAKDMRGRYPKHDWPLDPAAAKPHEGRTKKRL